MSYITTKRFQNLWNNSFRISRQQMKEKLGLVSILKQDWFANVYAMRAKKNSKLNKQEVGWGCEDEKDCPVPDAFALDEDKGLQEHPLKFNWRSGLESRRL